MGCNPRNRPRSPCSEGSSRARGASSHVSSHPGWHPVAVRTELTGFGQGNDHESGGKRPGQRKVNSLVNTPLATLSSMRPTTASQRFDATKSLVGEKGHRLGHTPVGTVADVETDSPYEPWMTGSAKRVTDGILARLNSPEGLDAFTTQVRAIRGCRRPVRLSGRVVGIVEGGRPEIRFDTRALPDGVLLKACGSRRETVCPPCASLYRGDAFALVAAGLRGGKGIPESIGEHPAVLLTLTAPSFGAVHRKRPDGTCHPWGACCSHGRALMCSQRHNDNEDALGQALCHDCYDYEAAVLFNAGASELWRRTTIYAIRALGSLLDLSARAASRQLRLSYVKVAEFQRRGSVHFHALVRADVRTDEHGDAPSGIEADMLATALQIAARKVTAPLPGADGDQRMAWGNQIDTAMVNDAENGRRRAAAYLAKYATKGSDKHGVLDHRLRTGVCRDERLPDHLRALVETAWSLGDDESFAAIRPQLWAHSCGFRGHFLTKSRRWSTTFGALRDERQQWRLVNGAGPLVDTNPSGDVAVDGKTDEVEVREWKYEGSGYLTTGDVCISRNLEEDLRLARWLSREDAEHRVQGEAPRSKTPVAIQESDLS